MHKLSSSSSSTSMAMSSSKLILLLIIPLPILVIISFFSSKASNLENVSSKKNEQFELIRIEGRGIGIGPESFAFDPFGEGPYTGLSDGRIIKWEEKKRQWIDFAITSPNRDGCQIAADEEEMEHICGRPLGLCFDQSNGNLYIADAYMGLLMVGPNGGLATTIATHVHGIPFAFTNSLDIDQSSGVMYFTDSSSQYPRRSYISIILSGDKSGRLMKYNPQNKQVTILLDKLSFPNGVTLSKDRNFILFAETNNCRVLRYWIKTSKAGTLEVFAQLPGFPDNIKRSPRGGYWIGIHSKREKVLQWILSYPWIGKALLKIPIDIMKVHSILAKYKGSGMALRLGENGEVLEMFENRDGGNKLRSISEVMEKDGKLWIGSINLPFVGRYKI